MKNITFSKLFTVITTLLAFSAVTVYSAEMKALKFKDQKIERDYILYVPDNIKPGAPFVYVLHGYGGNNKKLTQLGFNELADKNGFVVCYPLGSKDKKKRNCWNVGYPFQDNMKIDDISFLKRLYKHIQKEYNLSKKNVFCTGISNGGEMCYLLAYKASNMYRAVAPIAGLTMKWMFDDLEVKKPISLLEVHGTEDRTSEWFGDLKNKGGWGEYMPVPIAVNRFVAANRCHELKVDTIPSINKNNGHKVISHKYSKGDNGNEVWLYEVIGGNHSWSTNDINTPELVWDFFSKFIIEE